MKFLKTISFLILYTLSGYTQTTTQKLAKAYQDLVNDEQARYAITSLCVLDANTGKIVFAKNENIGLATASTLKTITSATAFYLLGKDFRYETKLSYTGRITTEGILHGNIIIKGYGDPTLGSWRYKQTKESEVLQQWTAAIQAAGIKKIEGGIVADDSAFGTATIPSGWIWQDIGNFYGAGGNALCWHENQFDILLKPGQHVGDEVKLIKTIPEMPQLIIKNELTTGTAGSGDHAYAFLAPYTRLAYLRGTWGINIQKKGISLSLPDAAYEVAVRLQETLIQNNISCTEKATTTRLLALKNHSISDTQQTLKSIFSPTLSEIIYWFNKKSINLYGEQLIKTIAFQQNKTINTENGIREVKNFWESKGIDPKTLNMIDGSGLSPGNRVTTSTMATILYQAQKEPWFTDYLKSFPQYNGMTIKSGNINDVTAYAGYHTTKDGKKYVVVINNNNYNGSQISHKLFKVLDVLK